MKKYILIPVLTLAILIGQLITLNAQDKGFIGAESSLLYSGIENQNPYGIAKLPAINTVGSTHSLLLGRYLKNGFQLSLEPTYAQLGQHYLHERQEGDFHRKISLNYLQMPVMISKVFGQRKVRIETKLGVYSAYLLNSTFEESTIIYDGKAIGAFEREENSERFTRLDLGFKASLGGQIAFTEKLAVNLRYNASVGLKDLNSVAYQYTPGFGLEYKKSRNMYAGVSLGFQYAF